ncbi:hypothetical protein F4781DRAFT_390135 [Annulohypoxylon bovei var. microspora]|nr:hypothetical protein F4781DRAFT_390135 [Annulohypoxylon bovei var. microspora]
MKGIMQSVRGGRPSKITKPTGTPRARPGRRIGTSDAHGLVNSDPTDLDQQDVTTDEDQDHHASFDHDAAAIAAAAAQHQHQQQQQQQEHQQQLDLTAASILASSVQNPNDQHSDLGGPHMDDGAGIHTTTEDLAQQSGYSNVIVESALAKRLAREPGMRHAHQRRPEQILNLGRRSNVEALFAHIAGEEAPQPCKNCHKGHGPWTSCVIVDGQMCGSCANCWFNASGARCSFHETRNPQAHGGQMLGNDSLAFPVPTAPPAAMAPFNFAVPASADPVVRYTVEQAMALVRGADKKARSMLMIEATARQLAFQIAQYEEAIEEEQNQANAQGAPQPVMNEQDAP